MNSELKLLSPGVLATIQDMGRTGFRQLGVPKSGVLHPDLARIANRLAGNSEDAAVIEFFMLGPTLRAEKGVVRVALAGDFTAELTRNRQVRSITSWRSVTLYAGDALEIKTVQSGKTGYIAVYGGFDIPKVMGSYSTYLRGGFGGIDGKPLAQQTLLPIFPQDFTLNQEDRFPEPPDTPLLGLRKNSEQDTPVPVRVVFGPQDDYFTDASKHAFLNGVYTITRDSDRMGSRLEGAVLQHQPDKKAEIISDAIVPGAIQVPGSGAPIILLADGPTVGGYPKIGAVITADLPKVSVLLPGSTIQFQAVTQEEATEALRAQRDAFTALLDSIDTVETEKGVDLSALYAINLISGVADALWD